MEPSWRPGDLCCVSMETALRRDQPGPSKWTQVVCRRSSRLLTLILVFTPHLSRTPPPVPPRSLPSIFKEG